MGEIVATQCPYCGVGCGLLAEERDGRLARVSGDPEHPVNRGATCAKPLELPVAVHAPDRALAPLWRQSGEARFERLSWRAAIGRLARRLGQIRERHGPDAIAFYISGQLLTEDYYAAGKLARVALATNNLDSNSRLCMSSAVAGYQGAFGSDGPPPAYSDIDCTDCMLLVGSNAAACHPILWARMLERQRQGAKLIVADPRRTPTAAAADLHLQLRPGSDLPLLSAMLLTILEEGLADRRFLAFHTEGLKDALTAAREWPPVRAADACGVPAEQILAAARIFARSQRAMALWSMGANQSRVGTLKNRAIINLCLATGNIGRPGSGPLSLTGQPNAMGGREAGGLAGLLPGYRSVSDPADRAQMRRLWRLPGDHPGVPPVPGLAATELIDALEAGSVRALWIVATNPVVSHPDARRFAIALRRAELLICQDAYHPTETSALAHVVLPAAQWPEKQGTMTNSERRVGLVRKLIEPPGEALADWEIFARLGRALGPAEQFHWRSAAEVYDEFAACTRGRPCDVSGLSHARLSSASAQWPAPRERPEGSERLYASLRFHTPGRRARLAATPHLEPADRPDERFGIVLCTGRIAGQWHTMTRTGKSRRLLASEPEPFVELHPRDAQRAGVSDGELVRLRSRRGHALVRARCSDSLAEGVAFAPFHWGALHLPPGRGAVGSLVARALDPISKQAELKATAVRLESLAVGHAGGGRDERPGARRRARRPGGQRLVIVGAGMAGVATARALLEHEGWQRWQITLVGRERDLPYNRILLSALLAGELDEPELALDDTRALRAHGARLLLGADARAVDLRRGTLELHDGERLGWERLVLATGSRPLLPPIAGLGAVAGAGARAGEAAAGRPRGEPPADVHVLRTLSDARRIIAAAGRARRAVVIGGGLLGIEAARARRARGLEVTVVHAVERLMERQLDAGAAALLHRAVRQLGIGVLVRAQAERIERDEHGAVRAVTLADGRELGAEMVVVAAGVAPEVQLARAAGLEVRGGVLVDDQMRASWPGVYAVGECAEHRGVLYGLWAPAAAQARVAAASLAGVPAAFHGTVPATTLKVAGIDLFCGGRPERRADDEELALLDTRRGLCRRLLLREQRLEGAILLGDLRDSGLLRELLANGEPVPDELLSAGGSDARAGRAREPSRSATVCSCMAVTRGEILDAVRAYGLASAREVAQRTRAGSGCGTCRGEIEAMLAAEQRARRRPREPEPQAA